FATFQGFSFENRFSAPGPVLPSWTRGRLRSPGLLSRGGRRMSLTNHDEQHDLSRPESTRLPDLIEELTSLRSAMLDLEEHGLAQAKELHATCRESARNLLHYLALRRQDIRTLQERLAALGLSSLGRAESCVLATVEAVLKALHHMSGQEWSPRPPPGG